MSRWFQELKVAGYPTRFEQECDEYERRLGINVVRSQTTPDGWLWELNANGDLLATSPMAKPIL